MFALKWSLWCIPPWFLSQNGPRRSKATREVADGNHGGLGRGQEGKNGLVGGLTSKHADVAIVRIRMNPDPDDLAVYYIFTSSPFFPFSLEAK